MSLRRLMARINLRPQTSRRIHIQNITHQMSPGLRSLPTGICLLMMVPVANASEREGLVLQVSKNDPQV